MAWVSIQIRRLNCEVRFVTPARISTVTCLGQLTHCTVVPASPEISMPIQPIVNSGLSKNGTRAASSSAPCWGTGAGLKQPAIFRSESILEAWRGPSSTRHPHVVKIRNRSGGGQKVETALRDETPMSIIMLPNLSISTSERHRDDPSRGVFWHKRAVP